MPADTVTEGASLADIIQKFNKGAFNAEATQALAQVVDGIKATGKKGSLKITIEIHPADRDANQVVLLLDHDAKPPKQNPGQGIYYTTRENCLVRQDPRQVEFPM